MALTIASAHPQLPDHPHSEGLSWPHAQGVPSFSSPLDVPPLLLHHSGRAHSIWRKPTGAAPQGPWLLLGTLCLWLFSAVTGWMSQTPRPFGQPSSLSSPCCSSFTPSLLASHLPQLSFSSHSSSQPDAGSGSCRVPCGSSRAFSVQPPAAPRSEALGPGLRSPRAHGLIPYGVTVAEPDLICSHLMATLTSNPFTEPSSVSFVLISCSCQPSDHPFASGPL